MNLKNNQLLKKITGLSTCICWIIVATNLVFAASFDSTYNMTGGLHSRTFTPSGSSPIVNVKIYPEIGVPGESMSLYLQRKVGLGYVDDASGSLVSTKVNDTDLKGKSKGTYRIYFRNWTGKKMSGDVRITY